MNESSLRIPVARGIEEELAAGMEPSPRILHFYCVYDWNTRERMLLPLDTAHAAEAFANPNGWKHVYKCSVVLSPPATADLRREIQATVCADESDELGSDTPIYAIARRLFMKFTSCVPTPWISGVNATWRGDDRDAQTTGPQRFSALALGKKFEITVREIP
jgi:hypothetical protein